MIEIVRFGDNTSKKTVTVYDSVSGGFPSPATDEIKEEMSIQEYLITHPVSTVSIRVKGDSMIGANLADGTIINVDKARHAQEGDIVVASVDGEYVVKYLAHDAKGYFLRPANPSYNDIRPQQEMTIFGVVVSYFHKLID